jgi:type IV secretory pathway VirB9-like protein
MLANNSFALEKTNSDSRIRSFIYGENDVFRINTIYGYQTVVEFDKDEKIATISIGNPNIFKIMPAKNRLFVKAMQNNQLTNLTLITNKRIYQIELSSFSDEEQEVMYYVKFIYPDSIESGDKTEVADSPMSIYAPLQLGENKFRKQERFDVPSVSKILDNAARANSNTGNYDNNQSNMARNF